MNSIVQAALARRTGSGARAVAAGAGAFLLAAVLAAGPALGGASWDDPTDSSDWLQCNSGINHWDASCLHGWWDNTPPASTGVAFGSTWGSQNRCGDWGTVYSRVDVNSSGGWDLGYLLDDWDKKRGNSSFSNVSSIKCCPYRGELCHKSQVKALSGGKVKVWNPDSGGYDVVTLNTAEKRQEFCKVRANRKGVYCRNNLSGDALDGVPYNCNEGTTYCNVEDCEKQFLKSLAFPKCTGNSGTQEPTYAISATDGTSRRCTVSASCRNGTVVIDGNPDHTYYSYTDKSFEADVYDVDEYVNCDNSDNIVHEDESC